MYQTEIEINRKNLDLVFAEFSSIGNYKGITVNKNHANGHISYRATFERPLLVGIGINALMQVCEEAAKHGFIRNSIFSHMTADKSILVEISFMRA